MTGSSRHLAFTLTCLGVGAGLMLGFDVAATRIAGVALLAAFIVSGVFLIADPAFLDEEER